ncbi:MAG: hypothetical protein ACJ746_27040 [Bryobacteraceae bacterium]
MTQLYPKDWNNLAPRVSLAYDVRGDAKTVVRAGWGLFYDAFSQDFFVGQLPWNTFNGDRRTTTSADLRRFSLAALHR